MHFAVAPVGSVLLADRVGADAAPDVDLAVGDDADAAPAGGGVAAGAADAVVGAAAADGAAAATGVFPAFT